MDDINLFHVLTLLHLYINRQLDSVGELRLHVDDFVPLCSPSSHSFALNSSSPQMLLLLSPPPSHWLTLWVSYPSASPALLNYSSFLLLRSLQPTILWMSILFFISFICQPIHRNTTSLPFYWILSMSVLMSGRQRICSVPSRTKALWSYPNHSLAAQDNCFKRH